MLGQIDWKQKEISIIGGGISGMLAAYRLDRLGFEVTLYEKSSRLGGLIQTIQTPFGLAERAAHSLLASKSVLDLASDLNVPMLTPRSGHTARWILREGRWRRFPLSFGELARLLLRMSTARTTDLSVSMTLREFSEHFMGKAAHDYLVSPFLLGIYGAKTDEVLVAEAFPDLLPSNGKTLLGHALASRMRRKSPRPKLMTPQFGMQSLVDRLGERIQSRLGSRLKLGQTLKELPESPNVMISAPADEAAHLLSASYPEVSQSLREVEYSPMVLATVFYDRQVLNALPTQPHGIGILIPPAEDHPFLGVLFNSSTWENRVVDNDRVDSFSVFLGGRIRPDILQMNDGQIKEILRSGFASLLSIQRDPIHTLIQRIPRAIPLYNEKVRTLRQVTEKSFSTKLGRILFGNYTGKVSLRGLIDTVANWK